MSFFPSEMPRPVPDMDDETFWASCAQGKLRFQSCGACHAVRHPPTPICFRCHSTKVEWVEAPNEGVIYSYTVIHHASHPVVAESLPYVGAVIEFAGFPGVRLVSNVTDVSPEELRIGMPVTVWWDDIDGGMQMPRFKPAS